ncbi:MAG TPA: MauE/DoxX family redox-associated membrane protein [Solirubrobacteraceae bacterium]|jgi:hypothetical protein|nr:MauE/DoxX family redox-associated membrane protein [Solirubrobacteraceae bacterium]
MSTLVSIWLGLILCVTAGLKAWRPARAAAGLATFGIAGAVAQRAGIRLLIVCELTVGSVLVAGVGWAPVAALALFALFAMVTSAALLAGRGGRPCACFGASSLLGWSSPARAAALALVAGVCATGLLPSAPAGYERWLTFALSLSVAALAALAVALLALAREVGVLRLSAGSRGALEIESEGPEVGLAQQWAQAIETEPGTSLRLAIFTSAGCPLCAQLTPALAHVAADPLLAVRTFDEHGDAAVWAQARVPGSPYAVALSADGVALAKGTFNSLSQLESVLSTARFRERGLTLAA